MCPDNIGFLLIGNGRQWSKYLTNPAKSPLNLGEKFWHKIHLPLTYICHLQLMFLPYPGSVAYSSLSRSHHHHHHYVPSVINRSAVMDLHRSRSCATLIQSLYDIFVHSLMLSIHIVLGLPRPLLPFIFPSISNRCTPSPLIICPKYWHFLFLIVFNKDLLVFILCKTSPLVCVLSMIFLTFSCIVTFQKPLICRMLL